MKFDCSFLSNSDQLTLDQLVTIHKSGLFANHLSGDLVLGNFTISWFWKILAKEPTLITKLRSKRTVAAILKLDLFTRSVLLQKIKLDIRGPLSKELFQHFAKLTSFEECMALLISNQLPKELEITRKEKIATMLNTPLYEKYLANNFGGWLGSKLFPDTTGYEERKEELKKLLPADLFRAYPTPEALSEAFMADKSEGIGGCLKQKLLALYEHAPAVTKA